MELRPFTRDDWMGFAGAEHGRNGEPPLIGSAGDHVVIVSGHAPSGGATVEVFVGEDEQMFGVRLSTFAAAAKFAAALPAEGFVPEEWGFTDWMNV